MRHRRRLVGDTPTPLSRIEGAVRWESRLSDKYSDYSPPAAQGSFSDPGSVPGSVGSQLRCTS